jgi:hypothetical protein
MNRKQIIVLAVIAVVDLLILGGLAVIVMRPSRPPVAHTYWPDFSSYPPTWTPTVTSMPMPTWTVNPTWTLEPTGTPAPTRPRRPTATPVPTFVPPELGSSGPLQLAYVGMGWRRYYTFLEIQFTNTSTGTQQVSHEDFTCVLSSGEELQAIQLDERGEPAMYTLEPEGAALVVVRCEAKKDAPLEHVLYKPSWARGQGLEIPFRQGF